VWWQRGRENEVERGGQMGVPMESVVGGHIRGNVHREERAKRRARATRAHMRVRAPPAGMKMPRRAWTRAQMCTVARAEGAQDNSKRTRNENAPLYCETWAESGSL